MKTKQRTGARALVEALERVGAELVFGYPGGNVVDIFDELSRALGCKVVEISALKGAGVTEAAEAAIDAAKNGTPSPMPSSEIIYNQAIIDGIAKSAALGKEITLDIPEI